MADGIGLTAHVDPPVLVDGASACDVEESFPALSTVTGGDVEILGYADADGAPFPFGVRTGDINDAGAACIRTTAAEFDPFIGNESALVDVDRPRGLGRE